MFKWELVFLSNQLQLWDLWDIHLQFLNQVYSQFKVEQLLKVLCNNQIWLQSNPVVSCKFLQVPWSQFKQEEVLLWFQLNQLLPKAFRCQSSLNIKPHHINLKFKPQHIKLKSRLNLNFLMNQLLVMDKLQLHS